MFKLTFILAVALYGGFVVWGQAPEQDVQIVVDRPAEVPVSTSGSEFDRPVILASTDSTGAAVTRTAVTETIVPDASLIAASAPAPGDVLAEPRRIGEPTVVSLLTPESRPATSEAVADTAGMLRVSGSRVNMRSGPSTSDAIVDSLAGGTLAEPLGEPVDGWIRIRDVATGATGYMSAQFLDPA
ncbi:SH3 domain-containing protein [Jannaschia rubra]|uniref:SH3 domain-containing protein n=1 Tax=Jannaschia rubra TaxID=282197 RepID=UPI00248FF35A|nr:SH3 domain-containing protein [Jannaschia rubra]